jgi:hypothetical protein
MCLDDKEEIDKVGWEQNAIDEVGRALLAGKDRRTIAQSLVDQIKANYDLGEPGIVPCEKSKEDACKEADGFKVEEPRWAEVAKEHGMLPQHATLLRNCALLEEFTVTFRESSKDCKNWIEKDYPMKPHDILEKSLSDKTIGVAKNSKEEFEILSKYRGLVGAYKPPVPPAEVKDARIIGLRAFNHKVIPLDYLATNPSEDDMLSRYGSPVTGDYDTLDFIDKNGNRVESESADEKKMIRAMNESVRGPDRGNNKRTNIVQHGPQASYLEFMKGHAEPMMWKQLQPELPVLAFDKDGNVYHFKAEGNFPARAKRALAAFYKCKCNPGEDIPPSWELSQARCEKLTELWNNSLLRGKEEACS